MRLRWNELTGIFLTAFATLLFEITATKIFEFSVWSNYAYLIISTAMFGLGLSGVILTRWPDLLRLRAARFLSLSAWLSGLTMLTAFAVLNGVPVHLPEAPQGWFREFLHVGVVFVALGIPFMFFGFAMSYLFTHRGERANAYYFADLLGAGLGCFALVRLISSIEPQGLTVLSAGTAMVGGCFFLLSEERLSRSRVVSAAVVGLAFAAGTAWWAPRFSDQVPLNVHVSKRSFARDLEAGRIEKTGWSALSRVDIAPMGPKRKRVWIAGGVNESSIVRFDGDYEKARAKRDYLLHRASRVLDHKALPHLSKQDHTVCMIGTSGGEDSLYALMAGARKVVGIEMDPMIARFVTEDYREFAGGLFTDGDYSELIVDEGRSFLRRTDRTFDVIQQVNNFTPIAFQNGALNLSETYLLTVESFRDFYDHLNPDGILSISRWGSIRLLSTGVEMFRRMGLEPEQYSKHMVVCQGSQWMINTFLMKKSPFTRAEIDRLFEFFDAGNHNRRILYAPYRTDELPDLEHNLFHKLATAADPEPYWRVGCFNFSPPTDEKPFFNRVKVLGMKDKHRDRLPLLPEEMMQVARSSFIDHRIPKGDFPPIVVLFEGLVLATVFFGVPMFTRRALRQSMRRDKKALGYFACLGIAFIFVEICLIQRLVLFLGAPVYSMAVVLCSLLVFAGVGSLLSGRIPATPRHLRWLLTAVAVAVLVLHVATPLVTRAFLGARLWVRMLVALLLTGMAGLLMGMPMPTGIRFLKHSGKPIIPWAWATNGYFTVLGSALSVLIATTMGFTVVFVVAALVYAAAPWFLSGARGPAPGQDMGGEA